MFQNFVTCCEHLLEQDVVGLHFQEISVGRNDYGNLYKNWHLLFFEPTAWVQIIIETWFKFSFNKERIDVMMP